jgi:hypothetical protein
MNDKFKAIFDSLSEEEKQVLLKLKYGYTKTILPSELYQALQGLQRLPRKFLREYGIKKGACN